MIIYWLRGSAASSVLFSFFSSSKIALFVFKPSSLLSAISLTFFWMPLTAIGKNIHIMKTINATTNKTNPKVPVKMPAIISSLCNLLTFNTSKVYPARASANSLAGISTPNYTGVQALNRSVFFVATCLWWAVWRRFGAPSLVSGSTNSV